MKVVVDVSVYVSALIGREGAAPQLVVDELIEDRVTAVISPMLLRELEAVLARPKFDGLVTAPERAEYVSRIRRHGLLVDDPPAVSGVVRDPDDDYLVALARAAEADVIVSVDWDLLDAGLGDLPVWTPRAFLDSRR